MIEPVAIYLAYCAVIAATAGTLYAWVDRRARGVLVPPAELKALREYRRERLDYLAWRKIPADEYPKSMARQIADRWDVLETERNDQCVRANAAEFHQGILDVRCAELVQNLAEAKRDADLGWRIAERRGSSLSVVTKRLEERDEELDVARREVSSLRDPHPHGWTVSEPSSWVM